jgi:hypothetical protein
LACAYLRLTPRLCGICGDRGYAKREGPPDPTGAEDSGRPRPAARALWTAERALGWFFSPCTIREGTVGAVAGSIDPGPRVLKLPWAVL